MTGLDPHEFTEKCAASGSAQSAPPLAVATGLSRL